MVSHVLPAAHNPAWLQHLDSQGLVPTWGGESMREWNLDMGMTENSFGHGKYLLLLLQRLTLSFTILISYTSAQQCAIENLDKKVGGLLLAKIYTKQYIHNVSISCHAAWALTPGDASFSPASLQYTSFSGKGSTQKQAKHTSEVYPYIIILSMKKKSGFYALWCSHERSIAQNHAPQNILKLWYLGLAQSSSLQQTWKSSQWATLSKSSLYGWGQVFRPAAVMFHQIFDHFSVPCLEFVLSVLKLIRIIRTHGSWEVVNPSFPGADTPKGCMGGKS